MTGPTVDRRTLLKLGLAAAALLPSGAAAAPVTPEPREKRLANLRQLTFGGQNAEAYFD